MTRHEALEAALAHRLGDRLLALPPGAGEATWQVEPGHLLEVMQVLRDDPALRFEQLMDVAGVDFLAYGLDEWKTQSATSSGFSRGVTRGAPPVAERHDGRSRFAVSYHLLSITHNWRLRLRCYCPDSDPPMIDSVTGIFSSAAWFEREAFDLFGILFKGHGDLRRLLTDYGFIGHPFRKDFPVSGNVEVRYDAELGRVVYEPVSIEPRTVVPRVIRHDNRYEPVLREAPDRG